MTKWKEEVALFLSDGTFFRLVKVYPCVTVQLYAVAKLGVTNRYFDYWPEDVGGMSYIERP